MTKTSETRTRAAADLAAQISAETETAHGLALALEILTAAGDDTPAGLYNAAKRRTEAAAVLQALCAQLDRMQTAADQLEEITVQLVQPISRAEICADCKSSKEKCALCFVRKSLLAEDQPGDQSGAGYQLDSGEALADFARRVQQMPLDQLDALTDQPGALSPADQISAAEQKRRTRKGGAAQ